MSHSHSRASMTREAFANTIVAIMLAALLL